MNEIKIEVSALNSFLERNKTDLEVAVGLVIIILWYSSSILSNNLNKTILDAFPFPFTLTIFQFGSITACCGILFFSSKTSFHLQKLSYERFFSIVCPLCISSVLAHLTTSISIQHVPVSFTHTIKSSSPIFAIIFTKYYGFKESYSLQLYISLLMIMVGVCLSSATEINSDAVGFIAAVVSTLIFCWQNAYSKKVLVDQALDHVNLLFYTSLVALCVTLPVWLFIDLPSLLQFFSPPSEPPPPIIETEAPFTLEPEPLKPVVVSHLMFLMVLNGVCHFGQNISAFTFMTKVTPLTYSVFNTFKRVVVIVSSISYFGNSIPFWNGMGMTFAIGGVALYNKAKYDLKVGEKKYPNSI